MIPTDPALSMGFPGMESTDSLSYSLGLDSSWVPANNGMDWVYSPHAYHPYPPESYMRPPG